MFEIPLKFVCGSWFSCICVFKCLCMWYMHKHHVSCTLLQCTYEKVHAHTVQFRKNMKIERVQNEWIREWSHSRNWPYEFKIRVKAESERTGQRRVWVTLVLHSLIKHIHTAGTHTHDIHAYFRYIYAICIHVHRKTLCCPFWNNNKKYIRTHVHMHINRLAGKQTDKHQFNACNVQNQNAFFSWVKWDDKWTIERSNKKRKKKQKQKRCPAFGK